jgi:hypothetical protein
MMSRNNPEYADEVRADLITHYQKNLIDYQTCLEIAKRTENSFLIKVLEVQIEMCKTYIEKYGGMIDG